MIRRGSAAVAGCASTGYQHKPQPLLPVCHAYDSGTRDARGGVYVDGLGRGPLGSAAYGAAQVGAQVAVQAGINAHCTQRTEAEKAADEAALVEYQRYQCENNRYWAGQPFCKSLPAPAKQ